MEKYDGVEFMLNIYSAVQLVTGLGVIKMEWTICWNVHRPIQPLF